MRRTLLLMPAYNEERNIGSTLQAVRAAVPGVDIVVVDDGSSDRTTQVAVENGATVLPLPFNLGYGGALQTGFRYAASRGYAEVVQIDADGQHEPKCILDLLDALRIEKADIVIGSRFLVGGDYKPSAARAMGMQLMRTIIRIVTGQKMSDPTSGFQALSRRAVELYASDVYPTDYPDADVLIMIHRAGLKAIEVPVTMYQRADGKSMHAGLKPIWYMFKMLLSIGVTMLRQAPATERQT
jgi:glycosyltransferase involved in cell wall biosynthesis